MAAISSEELLRPGAPKMPEFFWHVYNYVAGKWYETEYGQVEDADRWYHPTMIQLERFAAGMPSVFGGASASD